MRIGASLILDSEKSKLWLGSVQDANDKDWLKVNQITCVITVAIGQPVTYYDQKTHHEFQIEDKPNFQIIKYFNKVNKAIREGMKQGNVLIHCAAGVSRSATCLIAYLMQSQKMSFKEALQFVRERRKIIHPNPGFISQLKLYEGTQ